MFASYLRALKDVEEHLIAPLLKQGFTLYIVGGFVRDVLRGHTPRDADFAIDAEPKALRQALDAMGRRHILDERAFAHGTFKVVLPTRKEPIDVACLRRDVSIVGARHAQVAFTRNIFEDLARRDFTVNAMALRWPASRVEDIVDPFGGRADVKKKRVVFVGDAHMRVREDPLRLLRMARFACLDEAWRAHIDPSLTARYKDSWRLLDAVAMERRRHEFLCAMAMPAPKNFWQTLAKLGLADFMLRPLVDGFCFTTKTQDRDACLKQQHTSDRASQVHQRIDCGLAYLTTRTDDVALRLAATSIIAQDAVLEPEESDTPSNEKNISSFLGDASRFLARTQQWTEMWRLPRTLRSRVLHIAHISPKKSILTDPSLSADDATLLTLLAEVAQSAYGGPMDVHDFVWLFEARVAAAQTEHIQVALAPWVQRLIALARQKRPLVVKDLALNGHAIVACGVKAGPDIARVLRACLAHVKLMPEDNTPERLRAWLQGFVAKEEGGD